METVPVGYSFLFLTSLLFKKVPMETESLHPMGGTKQVLKIQVASGRSGPRFKSHLGT